MMLNNLLLYNVVLVRLGVGGSLFWFVSTSRDNFVYRFGVKFIVLLLLSLILFVIMELNMLINILVG